MQLLLNIGKRCVHASSSVSPRLAVIGSGPAGFTFTSSIIRLLPQARVDILDKLPVPFGLIRYGVAPDHPEVKNCIHDYERLVQKHENQLGYYGNVHVSDEGTAGDVTVDELLSFYDAVIIANGAEWERQLAIPGIDSKNSFSARRFVGWYNGLPRDKDLNPNLDGETAVVIGHGNVALDVARMLLLPISLLEKTDIAEHALSALRNSRIQRVVIVGRRGPMQVAFTTKELREMVNLPGSVCKFNLEDFAGVDTQLVESLARPRRRLTELMNKTANGEYKKDDIDIKSGKECTIRFLLSPTKVQETEQGLCVTFAKNSLDNFASERARTINTGETETVDCTLLVSSIGYQSIPLAGVPFDSERRVIATEGHASGRVLGKPRLYACGWCARGPVGVLATTQLEAKACAQTVFHDLHQGAICVDAAKQGGASLLSLLPSTKVVISWPRWKMIDRIESENASEDRPRSKLVNMEHIIRAALAPMQPLH